MTFGRPIEPADPPRVPRQSTSGTDLLERRAESGTVDLVTDEREVQTRRAFWLGASSPALVQSDDLLLPKPPGIVRRFWLRHARVADVLIALVAFAFGYLESIDDGTGLGGADWLVSGWFLAPVVASIALMWRRTRPIPVLGVVILCSLIVTIVHGTPIVSPTAVALYSVAVYRTALAAWIGGAVAFLLYLLVAALAHRLPVGSSIFLIFLLLALVLGINIGGRRRYLDALILRAAQLARERDQQAQLATAAERARIAREMHDVVAHSLSVMVRLSDGASAVADIDPERSRAAVGQIGDVGRDALRDMRRLLGVLSAEDSDETHSRLAPQPTLVDLPHLLETYRAAGLPVAIQQVGEAPTTDGLQLIVFRAVQESLTNALRYSHEPSRVLVQLDFTRGVTVVVSDDGFLRGTAPSVGSGRGLLGLRERAALYGGTVEAGPLGSDGRGWRLLMTLPPTREGAR